MTFPAPIIKFTVGGSVADEDIWSNGLTFAGASATATANLFAQHNPAEFVTAVNAFYATGTNSMNAFNDIRTIKMALVGPDGKYLLDPKIYDYPTPKVGTGAAGVSPQDSVVVSLLTEFKRGLARRGRIYLPAGFVTPVAATGRISPTDVTNTLAKAKTYFQAINAILQTAPSNGNIVVASSVREGAIHWVNAIELGNLVDNQSRRRNRLNEVYVTTPLTA